MSSRRRRSLTAAYDASVWVVALVLGEWLRYSIFSLSFDKPAGLAITVAAAVALQLGLGTAFGIYRGRWQSLSFEGAGAVAVTCASVTAALLALNLVDGRLVPESVPVIGASFALVFMFSSRYLARLLIERNSRPNGEECSRLLVFGAGEAGQEVIRSMLRTPDSRYMPVAVLDDRPASRNLSIMGVPVVGDRSDIAAARERFGADTLLIAVRSGSGAFHRELAGLAKDAGLEVKVVPSLREMIEGSARAGDIRKLRIEDVVGRREIRTDLAAAAGYLEGKRVLVTGAGGSIGSELCRQISRLSPSRLIMLDRDETALHNLQLSMEGRALLDSPDLLLLDIRDAEGVQRVFGELRPEVVFHAAALKHLPMLERHPGEAVQTNVWGTLYLLQASLRHGVERFVNISTDKAADPSSVLGYTKRIGERLTAAFGGAASDGAHYLSVRFGNVLGSRGSALQTFGEQIRARGPVTVTDPEVRRYFMTTEEAIQLVIQAGAVGSPGEALVLDMGESVRIGDVVQRMIDEAEAEIEVVYTGLRPGEKLDEVLFNEGEVDERPCHPLISHVSVPALHPGRVPRLDPAAPPEALRLGLRELCTSTGFRQDDEEVAESVGRPEAATTAEIPVVRLPSAREASIPGLAGDTSRRRCRWHRRWSDREEAASCPACSAQQQVRLAEAPPNGANGKAANGKAANGNGAGGSGERPPPVTGPWTPLPASSGTEGSP